MAQAIRFLIALIRPMRLKPSHETKRAVLLPPRWSPIEVQEPVETSTRIPEVNHEESPS
jgi:hypothetical protein